MLKQEIAKICKDCGKEFKTKAHNAKWCAECRKKYHFTKKKPLHKPKSLREVLADLKAYNIKHKTNLSYGQYVSMTE